ncbi:Type I restriction modification DNA specificity domain-containing protein [Monaibacterium marinum]|uniref:Type I restriction modification DNA specificity domain-containing protein n=1 Tax=Pontivivens marinum TaxID=1690039 RepID=A0A2C9CVC6_9RHOB|nr:restriction endonuclease subunit S [Monaibacterium marinum]SOH95227.1 Type I restriction modification DNA specificity domain-containing protein [Monaibacterium marinum]
MTELPTGWVETQISELVELQENGKPFQQGWSPQCESRPAEDDEWGVVKTTAIQHGEFWAHENKALPTNLDPKPLIEIKSGDVLMTCAGPRNRCGVACLVKTTRNKLMMSGKMYRFRPNAEALNPQFLSYFIGEHETQLRINEMKTGISDSGLNLTHGRFALLPVLVPPLNEQRRIVDKIEAMFERVDKGVENLQAARAALGLYRQSLLNSAFEGRLTADWRAANADKLEDPKALLARIQTEREARYATALHDWQTALEDWRSGGEEGKKPAKPKRPRDIPVTSIDLGLNGWAKIPLGLMIDTPSYGTSKKCDYDGGAYGVLRIPNIGAGRIDATDLKKADFDDNEAEQYSLIEGDILTVRSNGSLSIVGKPALVTAQDTGNLFAGYLIRIRANSDSLRPQYLAHIMTEPHIRGQIEAKAKSTSGVNNISAKELQDVNIPICSPAEQTEITRILDERLSAADTMKAEIDDALKRAEVLRQSILKQAFSGKLVPQDPDDEPAAALLARIKVEREAAPKAKRKKRGAA